MTHTFTTQYATPSEPPPLHQDLRVIVDCATYPMSYMGPVAEARDRIRAALKKLERFEKAAAYAVTVLLDTNALRAERDALAARVEALEGGTPGVAAIAAERKRQMEVEGWTAEHDDVHSSGQLAAAASQYAWVGAFNFDQNLGSRHLRMVPENWPWSPSWWKPRDRRSNLVRAGALIAAEIDRLDRAAGIEEPKGGE